MASRGRPETEKPSTEKQGFTNQRANGRRSMTGQPRLPAHRQVPAPTRTDFT